MAQDPKREDYQRLSLRFVRKLDASDPKGASHAFAAFGRRFAQDRDSLPQSDADRAFHLVALATEIVDYRLPFAAEADAERLVSRGKELLGEALALDPNCFDAQRMRASAEIPTLEGRYRHLVDTEPEVRRFCEAARDKALEEDGGFVDGERTHLSADLAMRPWRRWMASIAEEALICGRNHACLDACERLLAEDSLDTCDVRFTLAYALAKLEDEKGLAELEGRYSRISPLRSHDDAWMQLARIALAHKRCDFAAARETVRRLLSAYPGAADTLVRQTELPDGEFSRLCVAPYSEDELILAVSEGIVLLQEGSESSGMGVLGSWLAQTVRELDPGAADRESDAQAEGVES